MQSKISKELERIRKRNGGILRPEDIVASARDPKSVLHDHFEWEDTKAAELYRLVQARGIIRVAVTVLESNSASPVSIRTYVSLHDERGKKGGYRALSDVVSQPRLYRKLLEDARKEMTSFRDRYKQISELSPVFDAMDATEKSLAGESSEAA